jgi:exopolysaccharide biosynthesis polyprenyl glycosylphosphotransferase
MWVVSLALAGAYDARFLGTGPHEYQKVARASLRFFGWLAATTVAVGWRPDRSLVATVAASGVILLLVGRKLARRRLHNHRAVDGCVFRVLAVGDRRHVTHLIESLRRHPEAGFSVVGACTTGDVVDPIDEVPVVGALGDARAAAERLEVDVIAVTSGDVDDIAVKTLGWSLEGSGIQMALAPSLAHVAGPRISIHPVAGLPLIYVDEPDLGVARSVIKGVFDRLLAAVAMVVAMPAMIVIAVLIKLDSPGPVLFKQARAGEGGQLFKVWKFRSMREGSEQLARDMADANESDGLLFKVKSDPRVTAIGAWLRRWSLDELPQLVNVLAGQMSLIGPRPLPVSPDSFQGPERRRLMVKPGVTGLWQVSGRSDTTWEEAVRLDLYYVENWSLWLDIVILWKTARTVLSQTGAY